MAQKFKILLPKTSFPLRAKHPTSDPSVRSTAQFDQLYKWQLEARDQDAPTFVLHDGPPYANGAPHMGHALNKILKDIVNRYKLLRGYRVLYRPGWDCHGLPIELKACCDGKARSAMDIRRKAAEFAQNTLAQQREVFKRWGCFGDWDNPYLTMSKEYEKSQIGVFYEMYKKGCVYQEFKPVYWSPSSQTALAEAELEYRDHVSRSVYTLFPLESGGPLNIEGEVCALVWTTTPWTLPANQAICYHPDHTYLLVRIKGDNSGRLVLIGADCLDKLSPVMGELEVVQSLPGSKLEGVCYTNPLDELKTSRPFLPADHVSEKEGTGLVHTAPAHGYEDHSVGIKHGLDLTCSVDDRGRYSEDSGAELRGLRVLDQGNEAVCEKLRASGNLLHEHSYTHRYPYDWRSKKPIIIRATKQWFASLKSLKDKAKAAIVDTVTMYPPSARNRLLPMLDSRDDWCISRQRYWGVPLPIFYHASTNEPLVTAESISHVRDLIGQRGSDCWWEMETSELLPESLRSSAEHYRKGEDTMDVWFDSGSSWAAVLKGEFGSTGGVADMYLEGSDQHRGWFQSSLLTSVAVQDKAPYRTVLSHGFVLDKSGDKMSKSVGNVISPDNILDKKKLGADTMRLWVASSDYFRDVQLSEGILEQNADMLRKIRVTCRFMLGNLFDFEPASDLVPYSDLSKLDQYVLHLLSDYNRKAFTSYDSLEFAQLCHTLVTFVPHDLSSFYFAIVKDRLYCEEGGSEKRRATQTVLYHLLQTFVCSVSPILPHLAEEVAQYAPMRGSVFKSTWQDCPSEWNQPDLADQFQLLRSIISLSNGALENARIAKTIGSSLEAKVSIQTDSDAIKSVLHHLTGAESTNGIELPLNDYLIVSEATIEDKGPGGTIQVERSTQEEAPGTAISREALGASAGVQTKAPGATIREDDSSNYVFVGEDTIKYGSEEFSLRAVATPIRGRGKCPRCWKWVCAESEELCERCAKVESETGTHFTEQCLQN